MKLYKRVVIILASILGVIASILLNLASLVAILAYKNSVKSESYQTLKDYAFEIVNNSDVEEM